MNASSSAPSCNVTENPSTLIRLLPVDGLEACGGACVFFIDKMSLLLQKKLHMFIMHNICLNICFQTFLCHATQKKKKKTLHTQTLKHYKMSHPCLTVFLWPQIQCITYFQHETWACFDEHKTGILINWEPAGSTAVGVTFWVGTAHTELLGNCLFVFFKFKSVLKSWWVVVRL